MIQSDAPDHSPKRIEQRIDFLDILRGIAVLAIYAANIAFFSGYLSFPRDYQIAATLLPTDDVIDFLNHALIDGKFYSIFSLLFGIGCMVQYQSAKLRQKPFSTFFKRRMFWLFILGSIHLILIWKGDILSLYALLGFILIVFIKLPDRTLLRWAVVLLLLPIVNWLVIHLLGVDYPSFFGNLTTVYWEYFGYPTKEWNGRHFPDFLFFFQNESVVAFFKLNIGSSLLRVNHLLSDGRVFKVLAMFLIGLVTGRHLISNALLSNTTLLKRVAIWGIIVGLPLSIFRTYVDFFLKHSSEFWSFIDTVIYALATAPLALAYCSLIALLYNKNKKILKPLAAVGRMAFTNYIAQTVISIIVFYGIGFKLAGKFGFTVVMGIAMLMFIIQILYSNWWLSKFQFGPLEWVWRSLTYRQIQPFKRVD